MVKEIERAGIPVVHICTVTPISMTVGANRIVPAVAIPHPLGNPALDKEEEKKGKYIRRERYAGACSRSFYVGKEVHQDDIKAEFKHGILTLFVPKKEAKPAVEQKHSISIEG